MSLSSNGPVRQFCRQTVGLSLGGLAAVAETVFVLVVLAGWAVPSLRTWFLATAHHLATHDVRRIDAFLGPTNAVDWSERQALAYVRTRCLIGWLGLGVLTLIVIGAVSVPFLLYRFVSDDPSDVFGASWLGPITSLVVGTLLAFVTLQGFVGVVDLEVRTARRMLGPTTQELRRRVIELAVSRSDLVEAVNDERKRIERDLHDGIQQQLVALGMVLGRAARAVGSGQGSDLIHQAHEDAGRALRELREVSWRVYPAGLDEEGLHVVLRTLAERSGVPVTLRFEPADPLPRTVEVPAYFVASEAVANACKHAGATRIDLSVTRAGKMVVVTIVDDGAGGADPAGSGLSGLQRRVAAVDGTFRVHSPRGGPTVVVAELPCA